MVLCNYGHATTKVCIFSVSLEVIDKACWRVLLVVPAFTFFSLAVIGVIKRTLWLAPRSSTTYRHATTKLCIWLIYLFSIPCGHWQSWSKGSFGGFWHSHVFVPLSNWFLFLCHLRDWFEHGARIILASFGWFTFDVGYHFIQIFVSLLYHLTSPKSQIMILKERPSQNFIRKTLGIGTLAWGYTKDTVFP